MAGLLIASSLHKRLFYDEYHNLAYGYRFLTEGPGAAPEGQRMPVLALNALGCVKKQCRLSSVQRNESRRLWLRVPTMGFTLLLGLLVFRWASDLFGPASGLAALWLYVFDPNFLGHGKQVTSDVQASLFIAASIYFFWRMSRRWGPVPFLACALATAGALVCKFTSLLLLPVMALLLAWMGVRDARRGLLARPRVLRALGLALLFGLIVLLLLNAAYLFQGSFRPAREYPWQSRAFQPLRQATVPVPLPRVYALGLDHSSFLQENPEVGGGPNYVLGELNREGRWYAFPLMLLLKTPLALFVLLLWSARAGRQSAYGTREAVCLLVPCLAVVAAFSLVAKAQLGIRYILPAIPFLIVQAARPAAVAARGAHRLILFLLLAWQAGSTLSYHPHYIAYFNELIGPRVNAYRYLADSNLDWEDPWYFISSFRRRHPEMALVLEPEQPQAGYILVGVNGLLGINQAEQADRYRWLRENFEPIGHVAYSQLLFYVPPERLAELQSGRPPAPRR